MFAGEIWVPHSEELQNLGVPSTVGKNWIAPYIMFFKKTSICVLLLYFSLFVFLVINIWQNLCAPLRRLAKYRCPPLSE